MTELFHRLLQEGDAKRENGAFDAALDCYAQATESFPGSALGPFKSGTVLARLGRRAEAEDAYRKALSLDPRLADAANNLAMLLVDRGEWDEAERLYRQALSDSIGHINAHVNFSKLLLIAGRWHEALYYARRAVELEPNMALAWVRSGAALRRLGRIGDALAAMRQAVEKEPDLAIGWLTLAGCLQDIGDLKGADQAFETAVAHAPDDPSPRVCHLFFSNYLQLSREECWRRHREFGEWARALLGPAIRPNDLRTRAKGTRLRVGFVSGDFRRHSVAYFVRGALEHMARDRFELYAYHDFHKEDEVSAELKPLFNRWTDIFGQSDDAVHRRIIDDRIDILVDLAGHTGANRLMVFARRAAPVQISYLGYPNTTGLDTMDYRLTDAIADPPGDGERFHAEQLWRLSRPFLCYRPPESAPPIIFRQTPGLQIVLGSFNMRVKISDPCLDLWVQILEQLPQAVIVLKSVAGNEEEGVRDALKKRFADRGIAEHRVAILKETATLEEHLEMYGEVDIALDTFPYAGTTTTCEALWMGVPVVSLRGDRHTSRVGASILDATGLGDLVANSPEQYVRIVVSLANDATRRFQIREQMREKLLASQLLDSRHMASALGDAFENIWARFIERFPVTEENLVTEEESELSIQFGGSRAEQGWRLATGSPDIEADYVAGLTELDRFTSDSCARIWIREGLEAVDVTEMLPLMNNLYRILRQDGTLYISVFDFDALVGLFGDPLLNVGAKFQVMRRIYGQSGSSPGSSRIGLNFDFLVGYCQEAGFLSVEQIESQDLPADTADALIEGQPCVLHLRVKK